MTAGVPVRGVGVCGPRCECPMMTSLALHAALARALQLTLTPYPPFPPCLSPAYTPLVSSGRWRLLLGRHLATSEP